MPSFVVDNKIDRFVVEVKEDKITIRAEVKKTLYCLMGDIFYDVYADSSSPGKYIDGVFEYLTIKLRADNTK